MAKQNFISKIFGGSKKDYYEDGTWNDMHAMGHAFGSTRYSKEEGLKQFQSSLYVFRAVFNYRR